LVALAQEVEAVPALLIGAEASQNRAHLRSYPGLRLDLSEEQAAPRQAQQQEQEEEEHVGCRTYTDRNPHHLPQEVNESQVVLEGELWAYPWIAGAAVGEPERMEAVEVQLEAHLLEVVS
jgi:hypothetical protein